jgi:TrmH family RNA methyltransferase
MDMITSTRNPRIVDARKLDQRKHRQEQGRFAVEGLQLLGMALEGGYTPQEVFFAPDLFTGETAPALLNRLRQSPAQIVEVSADVLRALSERDTPQGIFAAFKLPEIGLESLLLSGDELVIVLDRLRDPGNVGTILRTADAVGAGAVIMLTPGVDVYDPKTVRASMGSLFNLPVIQMEDAAALFEYLTDRGLRIIGADAVRGQLWNQLSWHGGRALVLGSEAQGLSSDLEAFVTDWAALPIYGKADSLNVSVAGGVLMYAWASANK